MKTAAEPDIFKDAAELAEFLDGTFRLTVKEAQMLLGYMDGHGCCLGHSGGELYRGDLCYEQGKVHWEPDSIDDAVSDAADWNYALMQETETELMQAGDSSACAGRADELERLQEDGKALDEMFDRTEYGKELELLARTLADALIQDMEKEGMDAAVKKMADRIKDAGEPAPECSCILKQNTERRR